MSYETWNGITKNEMGDAIQLKFNTTVKTGRVSLPNLGDNTGLGMKCGQCLKSFKSYLRLKKHMADFHGADNEFSRGIDMSRTNRESLRKERLEFNEEALKDEISRLKNRR